MRELTQQIFASDIASLFISLFTDKLAETKKRDKEVREAFKADKEVRKEAKRDERAKLKQVVKMERSWEPELSKRGRHEAKVAARHEARSVSMPCTHGIHHCKLCQPRNHK